MQIPLNQIRDPERDLRYKIDADSLDELADSLRDHGQLQSIGVRQLRDDEYEVVFGARRTRAARALGWETIRAEILDEATEERNEGAKLIENVQRENLTPIEEGYGLISLCGEGEPDIRFLQRQTGKSREWIKSRLELIYLPEDIQAEVQAGRLSAAVAKQLGTIENPEIRNTYIEYARDNGCSADTAKIWAAQAQFAESGLTTMQLSDQERERMASEPQIIEQKLTCFKCYNPKSFREINTLVLCGNCQDDIAASRVKNIPG